MVHYGASEVCLDGQPIERFGTGGTMPELKVAYNPNTLPVNIVLDAHGEHVLAVRHSCMEMRDSVWRLGQVDRPAKYQTGRQRLCQSR